VGSKLGPNTYSIPNEAIKRLTLNISAKPSSSGNENDDIMKQDSIHIPAMVNQPPEIVTRKRESTQVLDIEDN
jgi:hypothetical protein